MTARIGSYSENGGGNHHSLRSIFPERATITVTLESIPATTTLTASDVASY